MNIGIKRRCFFGLLAVLIVMSGCSGKEEKRNDKVQAVPTETTDSVREKREGKQQNQGVLRLYLGELSSGLSPFFFLTEGDKRFLNLLYMKVSTGQGNDSGSQQEKAEDNYTAGAVQAADQPAGEAAEITVIKKAKSRHTVYRITIKDNVRDSYGNQMTSDDLLFNYYLRCQVDYRGLDQINRMNIVGLEKYQYGVGGKKLRVRKKKVKERMSFPTKEIAKKIGREIILPALKREYAWVESVYLDESQKKLISRYPQASMLFARYFAPNTNYTGKGKSKKQVLRDVAAQYGGDVKKLSRVTGEDYTVAARCLVIRQLWKKRRTGTGKIAGIRKRDDRTIEIETTDFQKKDRKRLGNIYLLPKCTFPSSKEDTGLPPGCGLYCLERWMRDSVWLVSNGYYQGGHPGITRIQVVRDVVGKGEDVSVECARKITQGELDMAIVWERISREKKSLRKALGDGEAAWKVVADGGVLYSTERINATTMPDRMTATKDVLEQIGQLKLN